MTDLVARRKQFSSCDECRRLRVRCDALARGAGSGHPGASPISCSRCTRRNERCTFEWMNRIQPQKAKKGNSRKSRAHAHARQKSASSTASTSKSNGALSDLAAGGRTSSSPTSAPAESLGSPHDLAPKTIDGDRLVQNGTRPETLIDPAILAPSPTAGLSVSDARMARVIYLAGFDTIFGSWMSRYGCPFLAGSCTGEDRNSIAEVCERLDRWMEEMSQADSPQGLKEHHRRQSSRDRQAEESLHGTIAAFAARWLPLVSREPNTSSHYQSVIHSLWRHARRDMLRVINRISYRSILSLFLFALTPVPADVSEEEEADGIFGQVCIHAALQQIQTLRARQRSLRFNGTKVSQPTKSEAIPPIPETVQTTDFIAAENIAYYAALTFDTSASLTLNCQSLLAAGLFGFEAEMSWSLVRAGATMFRDKWQNWQAEGVYVVTDDRANQIIASGTAWKLLTWKLAAILKEALRDGHDESEVQRAFSLVVEAMRQFNDTYKRPLEACEQRMPFLGQHTKFRWYSLMLHYHLSILLMANAIEATDRLDLFNEIKDTIASVESVVVNTLAFGLHNTTTMAIDVNSGVPDHVGATETSATVPLISIDPYPHHVVAAVQLVQVAIDRELEQRKITHSGHASVRSVLERALNHLPQSKSVKAARESFSKESHYSGEPPVPYSI